MGFGTIHFFNINNCVMQWTWWCATHYSRRKTLNKLRISLERMEYDWLSDDRENRCCLLNHVNVISSEKCILQYRMVIGRLVITMRLQKKVIVKLVILIFLYSYYFQCLCFFTVAKGFKC